MQLSNFQILRQRNPRKATVSREQVRFSLRIKETREEGISYTGGFSCLQFEAVSPFWDLNSGELVHRSSLLQSLVMSILVWNIIIGASWWLNGRESVCQCRRLRRHRFDLCIGKIPWRRKWQPTPLLFPGKSQGQKSLLGYSPWSRIRVRLGLMNKQRQQQSSS